MLCLMGKKRKAPTKAKAWMRMQAAELADNNIYEKIKDKFLDDMPDEVWINDRYQATIRYLNKDLGRDGICQMCIHSHTRATNRPWRHFQQIKNDVFGDEREDADDENYGGESTNEDQHFHHLVHIPIEIPAIQLVDGHIHHIDTRRHDLSSPRRVTISS